MDITVRRVGNSLGVIIPKATLDAWGVTEGDKLTVGEDGITPKRAAGLTHAAIEEDKLRHALQVVECFTPRQIRAKALANLHRWKASGAWVSAYDEWERILRDGDDGELFAAMLGRDERSARLRQSMPYVGLLSREQGRKLNEQAAGLEVIGRDSPFHEQFGYYADPVGVGTAVLPKGWKKRLVNLPAGDTGGAKGLCLEPHDLAISKYAAGRDKDREFLAGMVAHGMLEKDILVERLSTTSVDDARRASMTAAIERDFAVKTPQAAKSRRPR